MLAGHYTQQETTTSPIERKFAAICRDNGSPANWSRDNRRGQTDTADSRTPERLAAAVKLWQTHTHTHTSGSTCNRIVQGSVKKDTQVTQELDMDWIQP